MNHLSTGAWRIQKLVIDCTGMGHGSSQLVMPKRYTRSLQVVQMKQIVQKAGKLQKANL